ncbi:hypothetical protein ACFE04_024510 [Oxalis oulophora]
MFNKLLSKLPRVSSNNREQRKNSSTCAITSTGSTKIGNSDATLPPSCNSTSDSGKNNGRGVDSKVNGNSVFESLPGLRDVPSSEKLNLFIKKLNLCCVVFDFTDATKNLKEKETKRETLLELVEYVTSVNGKFSEAVLQEAIRMVSENIFRSFTPRPRENKITDGLDLEEDEPAMDPAWSHLQIVYEFFLRIVASPETDAKTAKRYIDQSFILKLLDLFDSEDPREREYLKTILHRVYGKFMVHRPFIRKAINNIFFTFVFETEKHNGIAEFLEILGSIINGFALPLKEEHKMFLVRALIPLHKPKSLPMYQQQLAYCITQFVEKDGRLADSVIRGLLRYWPITNSSKEVLFLNLLEEVLEATQPPEFQRCMVPLFHQIARCLTSLHFQVAERALFFWNNDHVQNLIIQNRPVILPIIFPALENNARKHWNQAVHGLTLNIRKMFNDIDPELFRECLDRYNEAESRREETEARREATWRRLEELAAEEGVKDETFPLANSKGSSTTNKRNAQLASIRGQPCSQIGYNCKCLFVYLSWY